MDSVFIWDVVMSSGESQQSQSLNRCCLKPAPGRSHSFS